MQFGLKIHGNLFVQFHVELSLQFMQTRNENNPRIIWIFKKNLDTLYAYVVVQMLKVKSSQNSDLWQDIWRFQRLFYREDALSNKQGQMDDVCDMLLHFGLLAWCLSFFINL